MNRYNPVKLEYTINSSVKLEKLLEENGILHLYLKDSDKISYEVTFDSHFSYRRIDESDALVTVNNINISGGLGSFLYRVEDSDFLEWFLNERCGPHKNLNYLHHLIASSDDILDIISLDEPIVRMF